MRQQQKLKMEGNKELPYTPIQFAYSETIGCKKSEGKSVSLYPHQYKDILKPKILEHHNPIFYLFFHTPTIYNWIRTITTNQSRLLDSYIRPSLPQKNINKIDGLKLNFLKTSIQDYVKKWEVVKLSFCHKVYVKKQLSGELCTHLPKTQAYTYEIEYNSKLKILEYPRIYCKECQQYYHFDCQTRQYSQYLLVNNPTQATLNINGIEYSVYFLISDTLAFIKSANKVWYEVNPSQRTIKPVGFASHINVKSMKIAAYSQPTSTEPILKIAQPFIQVQKEPIQEEIKEQMQAEQDHMASKQDSKAFNRIQPTKPKKALKQLKPKSGEIILKEQSKEYIQSVSKLYVEPKVKDQYQVSYDKGKLKKIKEKKEYIKPDFNKLHHQLKKNGTYASVPEKQGKKIKKKPKQKMISSQDDDEE